jgi:transposase
MIKVKLNEGYKVREIAGRLKRHKHTIRSWIKAYAVNGIEGLKSKDPSGHPRIKDPEVELEIDVLLIKSPREFGYQEERWTVRILLDYFSKKTTRCQRRYGSLIEQKEQSFL